MLAPDSICVQTLTCQLKEKNTLGKVRKLEVPWTPRNNYLINSDIYADSLQSAMFSACHNGKTFHIIGCKITFSRKTKKMSVLALWVVNLAFVACGKIYT